jgi:Holliday junction resolvase
LRYRRVKRDANHKEIVDKLVGVGCSVVDLAACGGGIPDILVGLAGRNVLLEIKNPETRKVRGDKIRETMAKQQAFRDSWRGQVAVVDSVEAAWKALGLRV